jgi:YHS domain-containing protein
MHIGSSHAVTRALLGVLTAAFALSALAGGPDNNMIATGPDNVAIKGYDTVAYFTEGQPVRGSSEFSHMWNDAEWHFANAANRDLFASNPEQYAPQFGGFCANGLSKGKKVVADPTAWTIVDGKLYLKFSEKARDEWRGDQEARIDRAIKNWGELQKQN